MTSGPENNTGTSSGQDASDPIAAATVQRVAEAMKELQRRTGYPLYQENSQRRYGPPPNWEGPAPPKGCEVFIGKIPRDLFEDELVPVMEKAGKIYEVRLMMESPGTNRGYGFVQFSNILEAEMALRTLNNFEIRPNRFLGVMRSVDNNRLFVGGIPKNRSREEVLEEMQRLTEGVVKIILYPCVNDRSKNRGYAFVEYESHKAAAMARRRLFSGRILLWGTNEVKVDWAEPELMVDNDTMAKVRVIYIRNLALCTTEDDLRELCCSIGGVERVKKQKDYAFVHFSTREQAESAKASLNGRVVHGCDLEVTWAKPVKNREEYQQRKALARSMVSAGHNQPSLIPHLSPTGEPLIMMPQVRRAAGAQGVQHPSPRSVTSRARHNESHILGLTAAPVFVPQELQHQATGEVLIPSYSNGAAYFDSEKMAGAFDDSRTSASDHSLRQLAANTRLLQASQTLRGPPISAAPYFMTPSMGVTPLMAPPVAAANPQNIAVPAGAYLVPSAPVAGYEALNPYAMQAAIYHQAVMSQQGLVMDKLRYASTGE
ncbi:probable RNA-binding protein 46 isoform X1 [Macrobrachium rosenbergii]|uniref:probable RNA-binding protein 46 isoform X1 n=1 Tax=Macrobrachium rosenbergii TaxID=79674 RepID=UPI0034D64723